METMEKYDKIGTNYNATRKADRYLTSRLIHHLEPTEDKIYLDIGCGTGNYTMAFANDRFQFIGVEPSDKMLAKARTKAKAKSENKSVKIKWKKGRVEAIPLENNSVDGAIGTLTMHHWESLEQGFSELSRVVKSNSKIVLFTSTPQQMRGYWLNHYFPKMLVDSMVQMPTLEKVISAMTNSGFSIIGLEKYFIQPDLEDLFLYSGKHNPSLYFEKQVRHGISSFSALANREEVQVGLKKLLVDIENGQINSVIKSYENDDGDYLYIIGKRN